MRSVLDRTTWINGDATVSVCALVEQDGGQILSVVGGKIAGPLGQSLFLNKYPHHNEWLTLIWAITSCILPVDGYLWSC